MKKAKVSEIESALLDYWVQAALDGNPSRSDVILYSSDWSEGGPIIERERIELRPLKKGWVASIGSLSHHGETALIAAMRCFVVSKYGEEVDLVNLN